MEQEPEHGDALADLRPLLASVLEHDDDDGQLKALAAAAARLCGTPLAAVSLLDRTHQVLVAGVGFPVRSFELAHSICRVTVRSARSLVVADLSADHRFASGLFVAAPDGLRAYAGLPLRLHGAYVGTLCVADTSVRTFTSSQVRSLEELASVAEGLLEARASTTRLRDAVARADEADDARAAADAIATGALRRSDAVTGLADERYLREHLEAAVSGGGRPALVLLDLFRFRWVNDALGRDVGDSVLRAVADRLRGAPGVALLARLGTDQFAVVLDGLDEVGARSAAADLRARVEGSVEVQGTWVDVRAAVAVALACAGPPGGAGAAGGPPAEVRGSAAALSLLSEADAALRQAKASGQVELFASDDRVPVADRLATASALHRSVERGELALLYQPVVDLASDRVVSAEALVRWDRPGHGRVRPDLFVPLAEETGFVVEMGRWVLEQACRDAAAWQRSDGMAGAGVHVNVSVRQLVAPEVLAHVADALAGSGLLPHLLTLEITESVFADDTDRVLAVLHELASWGVRLALDDFGTGYASLSYLQRLPLHTLKVDKSFVDDVADRGRGEALVDVSVRLAEALGMETVAEGVETAEQAHTLRFLGCRWAQGYLFARPLPAQELVDLRLERVPAPPQEWGPAVPDVSVPVPRAALPSVRVSGPPR